MPLFECSQCHVIDNTALGSFWWRTGQENLPALCSQYDEGKWHGKFDRIHINDYRRMYPDSKIAYPVTPTETQS